MHRRRALGLSVVVVLVGAVLATGLLASPTSAAADDADEVLLVEPNGRWHIRVPGESDYTFWYGMGGDVALFGDWDGDGYDSPGMYRPTTGFVYLTNVIPPDGAVGFGDPALTYFFGSSGDQVFVGDWDGNGTDTLGISRNGKMFLTNTHGTAAAEDEFWFGFPTDIAFGGNHDGVGGDTVFLYRPSTGFVYYTASIPAGNVAATAGEFFFGEPGDLLVIGDWDGAGGDTAGVFRIWNTTIYLRNTLNTGPADTSYVWGESTWVPVAGKFNLPPPITYELRTYAYVDGLFGSVVSDPPGIICVNSRSADCIEEYPAGTQVTLTATPGESWTRFVEWIGGDCGSANPCTITMNSDLLVYPSWSLGPDVAQLEVSPSEGGTVNSDPPGIDGCSSDNPTGCVSDFTLGSHVTLTASPGPGYQFSGWSYCSQPTPSCTVFISQAWLVAATFTPNTASLPIRVNAGGPALAAVDGGPIWMGDRQSSPSTFVNFQAGDPENLTVEWARPTIGDSVPTTTPGAVFASERYDNPGGTEMHWNFPLVSDQWVEVRLYFASGFPGASDLVERLFDVSLDDWLVLDDYDIVAEVGHGVGVMKRFTVKTDADGLDIVFTHLDPAVQNPLINAIEIVAPERLVVVGMGGSIEPGAGGGNLLQALRDVAAMPKGPGNEWTIKIEPGVYQPFEPIVLEPFVDIEGSGKAQTQIFVSSFSPTFNPRAAVVAADNSSIRHLGIEVVDAGYDNWDNVTYGILSLGGSPRIESVAIDLDYVRLTGIRVEGGSPHIRDVDVSAVNNNTSTMVGIEFIDSSPTVANLDLQINSAVNGRAMAFIASNSDFDLSHSSLAAYNNAWGSTGLSVGGSEIRLKDVYVEATGGWHPAIAVRGNDSTLTFEDVTATVDVNGLNSTAALFTDSTVNIHQSSFTATDGDPPFLMTINGSNVTMTDVYISSFENTYSTGRGITLNDGALPLALLIEDSTVVAPDWIITNNSTGTATLRNSILDGGPMLGTGQVVCQNVWDENGTFYANTCPG